MPLEYRWLGPGDEPVLRELSQRSDELGDGEAEPRYAPLPPAAAAAFLTERKNHLLVAFDGERPVGMLLADGAVPSRGRETADRRRRHVRLRRRRRVVRLVVAARAAASDRELLAAAVAAVRDALGRDPLGLYLFGSATLGGLRPASDLDLLAVVGRPTTRAEKEELVRRLLAISARRAGAERWRPVELTLVVGSDVRPWRYPPTMDFQYGDWLRSDFERDEGSVWQPSPNPDLAVLVTMALLSGRRVLGQAAGELLDPVPFADVDRSIVDGIPGLRAELDSDTRNVILTLARGWATVATGEIRSKDAAAEWALRELPPEHRPPLARARDLYVSGTDDGWVEIATASITAYADYASTKIEAAAR